MRISTTENSKLLQCARNLQRYAAIITGTGIIVSAVFAVLQLRAGNHQAKIANTIAFLAQMQTPEFHESYHLGAEWLENHLRGRTAESSASDAKIAEKLSFVLDRYQSLWCLYHKNVLDRQTVDASVGVQIAQFWLLTRNALGDEQRRGYDDLDLFLAALEETIPVNGSKAYRELKKEITQCMQTRRSQQ